MFTKDLKSSESTVCISYKLNRTIFANHLKAQNLAFRKEIGSILGEKQELCIMQSLKITNLWNIVNKNNISQNLSIVEIRKTFLNEIHYRYR